VTTAVETYTWEAYEAKLKVYLGLTGDTSEDTQLQDYLTGAAEDCDNYTENDFTDADGNPIIHPVNIWLGIVAWVTAYRSWYDPERNAGLSQVQTGPLREMYRGGVSGTDGSILARSAAFPHWYPSKVDVSREGVGY
jgi:hypothetical protein